MPNREMTFFFSKKCISFNFLGVYCTDLWSRTLTHPQPLGLRSMINITNLRLHFGAVVIALKRQRIEIVSVM